MYPRLESPTSRKVRTAVEHSILTEPGQFRVLQLKGQLEVMSRNGFMIDRRVTEANRSCRCRQRILERSRPRPIGSGHGITCRPASEKARVGLRLNVRLRNAIEEQCSATLGITDRAIDVGFVFIG